MNACPIVDRVTRPLSPSVVPNDEGSKLCAADGWIDEGWELVTSTLSKLSGKASRIFRVESNHQSLRPIFDTFRT